MRRGRIEVCERLLPDRDTALQAFGLSFDRTFPHLNIGNRQIETAFDDLTNFARQRLGIPLGRDALADILQQSAGQAIGPRVAFPLHVRSDRNEVDETAFELDASDFSGGAVPFPPAARWDEELVAPLDRTAQWLRSRNIGRIALSGSYRLTTAFAVGRSFRSATGFEIEIPTRDGAWLTDDRTRSDETYPVWDLRDAQGRHNGRLVVSVGVLRDPAADLVSNGVSPDVILRAHLAAPLVSGRAAQHGASIVKSTVSAAAARLKPVVVDLYIAGPAAFAVALGHRWNALPPTQLHEFVSEKRDYVPTALV